MDLLTSYGSDVSENEDDHVPSINSAPLAADKQNVMRTASQTQQHSAQAEPALFKGKQGPQSGDAVLWADLPRPTVPPSTSGLSSLPPPSGSDGRGGARKTVTMQLPFRKELLAAALDSDDEDEPSAKRVKTTGGKSRLMDFLPPPKQDTGGTRLLGVAARGASSLAGTLNSAEALEMGGSMGVSAGGADAAGGSSTLPADFFSGEATVYSNEAYRIADEDDAGSVGAYPAPSAEAYPKGTYYNPAYYDPSAHYNHDYGHTTGPRAPPVGPASGGSRVSVSAQGPEDLIAEALRAETERASKRGGGGAASVKLVEINAKDLTQMDPAAKEAANSARDALGPEYSLSLRRSAAPFEGSKMARRKHQIGTLLFNARMQELEHMEKRTQGQKSKAETAAKYGW